MLCPKCNKEISNDSQFCQYCGVRIETQNKDGKNKTSILGFTFGIIGLLIISIFIKVLHQRFISPKIHSTIKSTVNKSEVKSAVFTRIFYLSSTEYLKMYCKDTGYIPNNFINSFSESFKNSIQHADEIIEQNGFNKNELNNNSNFKNKIFAEYHKDFKQYQAKLNTGKTSKKDYCKMYDENAINMVTTKINVFKNAKPDLFFD